MFIFNASFICGCSWILFRFFEFYTITTMIEIWNRFLFWQIKNTSSDLITSLTNTLCELLIFFSKNSILIFRENCRSFWVKNSWKCCGCGLLAVDNFDFTRKIVKKILDEKLVKMLGFCQNWIFENIWIFAPKIINSFNLTWFVICLLEFSRQKWEKREGKLMFHKRAIF